MFLRDLRYAVRGLTKTPAYALTCIIVLALGIGASAAIFSIVSAVILHRLPYPEKDRLVFVWERFPNMPDPPGGRINAAYRNYVAWRKQNTVFDAMAAFRAMPLNELVNGVPQKVSVGFASAALFPILGAQARTGRVFTAANEQKGSDLVAVLTDAYFNRRFHRDPNAQGRRISIGNASYTVIGVLPPGFFVPSTWEGSDQIKPDIWVPLSRLFTTADDETNRQLLVAARLKPGISLARARTEMEVIAQRLGKADPKLDEGWRTNVFPFEVEDASPALHRALWVLFAAVLFLLLIACANLANLTLVRAARRSRENAVRLALGASRMAVAVHLLLESLIAAVAGGALGLLFAHWCVRLILALEPPDIQRPELIGINAPVLLFAVAASIVTAILFGLAPSLAASRTDIQTALKSGGGWGASAARGRGRKLLIAIEVALALVLVAGAGLMIRSFERLVATGIGFETARLMTADIDLPERRYADPASRSRFFRALMDRVRSLPGITAVTVTDALPLHRVQSANFFIAGRPDPPITALPIADFANVSPDYFDVLGLRLEAGRFFTSADLARNETGHDGVTIVNESFARKFFNGENPLGKRLLSSGRKRAFEIVGVVSDYRPMGVENGTRPERFSPYLKVSSATLVARTPAQTPAIASAIRRAVYDLDRELTIDKIEPMQYYVDEWQSQRKFNTMLLSVFAGLALMLAMIGVYGVMSNLVAGRVREIGIRMAIGARPFEIGKLILRQSMEPVLAGIAIGIASALITGRFLETLLFEVRPSDPVTLALVVFSILVVSPLAVYFPLRRATAVDCTVALREE